jgi:hypothetical protein
VVNLILNGLSGIYIGKVCCKMPATATMAALTMASLGHMIQIEMRNLLFNRVEPILAYQK